MGLQQADVALYIDAADEAHARLRNAAPTSPQELPHLKLSDFATNNIHFNLGNITVLEISNCDLTEIPHNIQKLNLKQLILTHNKLKEVPSCLYSGLSSLELLDLSHNFLTDFQVAPACREGIVKLKLSNNKIRDFPQWILSLSCLKLEEVYYSRNCVVKLDVSRELGIKKLEMGNCQLMDVDFVFLKRIKTLEALDISNDTSSRNENRFKDINKLFSRTRWQKLASLNLNNVTLSIIPKGLFWLVSLKELHLVNCSLNWIPEEIEHLHNLRTIDISENFICSLPKQLTLLEELRVIKAHHNYISSVSRFHGDLEILDLYDNQLDSFTQCIDNITYIDLEKNAFDTSILNQPKNYCLKRDKLREVLNFHNRINGKIDLPEDDPESCDEDYTCDLSFDEPDNNPPHYYHMEIEEECWDEEKPEEVVPSVTNPEITPSDDEWNGKVEIIYRKKLTNLSLQFDADEDWIFADVEEATN
ncbi:leucine-rich repeat and death domain-containing protein 1-like [Zophobas morio]|uniref:leucine-rich repeat and death domain-containing protein 1-like n=1 Tax=Zophobas morio TaxID=2755281 RepID=UPI0030836618